MQRLSQLAEIGRDGRAGAHRPGLSAAEQEACELVATWLRQEDMAVSWDACGNLYGRLGVLLAVGLLLLWVCQRLFERAQGNFAQEL